MKYLLCFIFLIASYFSYTQEYQNAFGFRGAETWGPSYKFFVNEKYGVEIIASFRKKGMQFTALMESHRPVLLDYTDHLYFYRGIGAHVGYLRNYDREYDSLTKNYNYRYYGHSMPIIGGDFIAGLEYRFYSIPLAVSVDWKPFVEFFGKPFVNIRIFDIGGSVKFTF